MEKILEIKGLEKGYKGNKAVDKLNFNLYKGEILGLLGPNGAGKSTTINILSTILKRDSGEIKFFGRNLDKNEKFIKEKLGIVPQDLGIFEDISAYKNVEFFASLYGLKKEELKRNVVEALEFVGLKDKMNHKPKTFSGGMKRRLNIACAIAHKPEIVILDEPTVGIDPQSRNHILQSIKNYRDNGGTIIYTTHYMEEVQEISDRIVIMDKGKKIADGKLEELIKSYKGTIIYKINVGKKLQKNKCEFLYSIEGVQNVECIGENVNITCIKEVGNLDRIILMLMENKIAIGSMETEEANLERVFLNLTGRNLRD